MLEIKKCKTGIHTWKRLSSRGPKDPMRWVMSLAMTMMSRPSGNSGVFNVIFQATIPISFSPCSRFSSRSSFRESRTSSTDEKAASGLLMTSLFPCTRPLLYILHCSWSACEISINQSINQSINHITGLCGFIRIQNIANSN